MQTDGRTDNLPWQCRAPPGFARKSHTGDLSTHCVHMYVMPFRFNELLSSAQWCVCTGVDRLSTEVECKRTSQLSMAFRLTYKHVDTRHLSDQQVRQTVVDITR